VAVHRHLAADMVELLAHNPGRHLVAGPRDLLVGSLLVWLGACAGHGGHTVQHSRVPAAGVGF